MVCRQLCSNAVTFYHNSAMSEQLLEAVLTTLLLKSKQS